MSWIHDSTYCNVVFYKHGSYHRCPHFGILLPEGTQKCPSGHPVALGFRQDGTQPINPNFGGWLSRFTHFVGEVS